MNGSMGVDMMRQALLIAMQVAAPLLVTALVVGVLVGLLQAITQIQEQTLTFLPKLALMALVFALTLPWALTRLVEYLAGVLRSLPTLAS